MHPLRGEEIVKRTGTGMNFGAAAPPGDPKSPAASPFRAFGDPSRTGCPPGRYGMKPGGITTPWWPGPSWPYAPPHPSRAASSDE